jgi:membrane protein YqaA with SNARE-associated domain
MEWLIAASVSAIASVIGGAVSLFLKRRAVEAREAAEENYRQHTESLRAALAKDLVESIEDEATREQLQQKVMANLMPAMTAHLVGMSKTEVQQEVNASTESLKQRIEQIEQRLPDRNVVDKIASVNEAVLATHVELLQEAVKRLEEKMLSKWDVAAVVFTVIAALGGLVGLTLTIIKFVKL